MKKKIGGLRRMIAGALCAAVLAGYVPVIGAVAAAEEPWVEPYLNQLVDWGVMRGDQLGNLDPDRPISRAEFVSMVNRAYGYTQPGETPFTDVPTAAWFADDIGIAYRSGYFTGTTENTASPDAYLTREQATVILARNLALQGEVGESMDFTDSRELSEWSRSLVKNAARHGIAKGYPDGSFRPQNHITRGEVASLLVSAVGNLVNQPGDHVLGDVYGNVTISAAGVTLKNTVITGDLYLTGGVGLGNVTLENVTVLGRIIASGAGESHKGDSSIILRNVEAAEMVVDTPANQFVTLRAEGDTRIDKISVRAPAYLEDTTGEDFGLRQIVLDAENGTTLQLAGNIKEVVNMTSAGRLVIAKGEAELVTVDEKALGSSVSVEMGAHIRDLRLDVATNVDGPGAVGKVTVNAPGSTVTMLPDQIFIRPGLDANVGGGSMNTVTGQESSEAPRLLAGYPKMKNVAATAADAVFSTNKKGTVYWAVSAVSDGSVGEEELIEPAKYGSIVVKNGSMKADLSNQAYPIAVTGLNKASGYYLSAMVEDERGQRSPVKVISFGTPDDTVPNFAPNHPYMSRVTNISGQMTVMTTKDCRVYYALMPKGAVAPTPADFKGGNLSGNLGYGTLDVAKNNTYTQPVNDKQLEEVKEYDLYVWLNDIDGAKSSAVKKISFTTVDMTAPEFTDPVVTSQQATSVGLTMSMNEVGTIYWVVVKAGTEYPKPGAGETVAPGLSDLAAKIQVANGAGGVLKSGKQAMQEDKEAVINVAGLQAETTYEIYMIAQDKAGNYAPAVKKLQFNTLDPNAPTATIEFTKYNGTDKMNPTADTDIRIVFNEIVQTYPGGKLLTELYTDGDKEAVNTALQEVFQMYDLTGGRETLAPIHPAENWLINYKEAEIALEDGKTVVTFKTSKGALNLKSGSTYRIDVQKVSDISRNPVGTLYLPEKKGFTTIYAQVNLRQTSQQSIAVKDRGTVELDMSFDLTPLGTNKVDSTIAWDMILWSDTWVSFELYRKIGNNIWEPVPVPALATDPIKETGIKVPDGSTKMLGVSETNHVRGERTFGKLREKLAEGQVYEYGVRFVSINENPDRTSWNKNVSFKVGIVAGSDNSLWNLSRDVTESSWNDLVVKGDLNSIGTSVAQGTDELTMRKIFSDTEAPKFRDGYPLFAPGDSNVNITAMLNRAGTIYYVVAPVEEGTETSSVSTMTSSGSVLWSSLPEDGTDSYPADLVLTEPQYADIVNQRVGEGNTDIKFGTASGSASASRITVTGLKPLTKYFAYFVTQGSSTVYSDVKVFGFETRAVTRPKLTLTLDASNVTIRTDQDADVNYLLIAEDSIPSWLSEKFETKVDDTLKTVEHKWNETKWGTASSYTLWNAIQDDHYIDGEMVGSVFDYFVNQTTKDAVAEQIRSTKASSNVALVGEVRVERGNPITVDCATDGKMKPGTEYTFLAVGKSPLGSGDAFRATRPVKLRDSEPPVVIGCLPSNFAESASNPGKYSGTLTLTFSKPLYYRQGGGTGSAQKLMGIEATDTVTGEFAPTLIALSTVINPALGVKISSNNIKEVPLTTVNFDFTLVAPGRILTFLSDVVSSTGVGHNIALEIEMVPGVVTGTTTALPTFKIVPAVWDGRNKTP